MQKPKPQWLTLALILATSTSIATAQQAKHTALDELEAETRPTASRTTATVIEYAIPATMIAYGALSLKSGTLEKIDCKTRDSLVENNRCINNNADNFLAPAPAAAAFILKAAGVESKNTTTDMIAMYAISNIAQAGVTFGAKSWAKRERPDASDCNSFPSAHTAIAFTAAEFLHQEYGHKSPWISVGGYTVASAVGASRVLNNKHWVSDVVAGAGIGILCTKVTYLLYPKIKYKITGSKSKPQTLIIPDYSDGTVTLKVMHSF